MAEGVSRRARRFEVFSAVPMSLATVATAWCACRSAEWGGEQASMLSAFGTMPTYPVWR